MITLAESRVILRELKTIRIMIHAMSYTEAENNATSAIVHKLLYTGLCFIVLKFIYVLIYIFSYVASLYDIRNLS